MGLLGALDLLNLGGPEFLGTYVGLGLAAILAGGLLRWLARAPFDLPSETAFQPQQVHRLPLHEYQLAFLAGGATRAVDAAITSLFVRGVLQASSTGRKFHSATTLPPSSPRLEQTLHDAAGPMPGLTRGELQHAASNTIGEIAAGLRTMGMVPAAGGLHVRLLTVAPGLLLLGLAVAKILIGIERQRPVVLLAILAFITALLVAGAFFIPVHSTVRGQRLLRSTQASHAALRQATAGGQEPIGPDQASLAVAMFGVTALAATPYAALSTMISPPRTPSDTTGSSCSSCSSGGGGSDGGGGGGGCGGCST